MWYPDIPFLSLIVCPKHNQAYFHMFILFCHVTSTSEAVLNGSVRVIALMFVLTICGTISVCKWLMVKCTSIFLVQWLFCSPIEVLMHMRFLFFLPHIGTKCIKLVIDCSSMRLIVVAESVLKTPGLQNISKGHCDWIHCDPLLIGFSCGMQHHLLSSWKPTGWTDAFSYFMTLHKSHIVHCWCQ